MERRHRSVVRLTVLVCWAAWLNFATAQEILRYEDGSSSRQEQGQPGRKVTGQWSWVDAAGKSHRVWYVADEFGFQAYGDTLPQLASDDRAAAADGGLSADAPQFLQPDAAARSTAAHVPVVDIAESANSTKEINEKNERKVLRLSDADSSGTQTNLAVEDARSGIQQRRGRVLSDAATDTSLEGRSAPTTQIRLKNEMASKSSRNNGFGKMLTGEVSRASQDLFHSDLPNPIDGTNFVLINRLQPPTVPKQRAPPTRLTPVLVAMGRPKAVISGVHTSSRSKSLSATLQGGSTAVRESIVPQPLKVEGNLNLDNFFSPINAAKATPPPFQIGSLDDYYYYDYDYYDYADFSNNATTNSSSLRSEGTAGPGQRSASRPLVNSQSAVADSSAAKPAPNAAQPSGLAASSSASSRLPVPAKVTLVPEAELEEGSISAGSSARVSAEDGSGKSSEGSSTEAFPKGSRKNGSGESKTKGTKSIARGRTDTRQFSFPPALPPPPRIPASGSASARHASSRSDGDNSSSREHQSSEDEHDDSKESTRERDD